jgi:hypothetical protein
MQTKLTSTLLAAFAALSAHTASADLSLISSISANQPGGFSAGEITAFDSGTDRLFVTSSGTNVHRINIFDYSNPSVPSAIGTVDYSTTFGAATDMLGLSSVAVDPQGRFGVATLIPAANTTTLGKVGFFNLSNGALLGTADVGYHPDSVSFSSDGSRLVIVNEGETNPLSLTNAPGSISVFNVSGINSGNLNTLASLTATTRDFSAGNLASGVSIANLRNHNTAAIGTSGTFIGAVPARGDATAEVIEPEYATISGDKVFVSLQENNAVATYDLTSDKWVAVTDLGTREKLIDASDTGSTINITQTVKGLPMPDTVASFASGGKTYVVSANEGDARVDDRDVSRLGDIAGNDSMNPILDASFPTTQTGIRANAELGKLNVSRLDGDTNADGKIDTPVMLGTRDFAIYEQTSGGLVEVSNSGSFFEQYIRDNDAAGWQDGRSDDKGPEPEGLTVGVIDGRTYLFIGMERTAHIFQFDITDPVSPVFVDEFRLADGTNSPLRPEGFNFISAANSPTGVPLLVIGFEGDGTAVGSERVVTLSVTGSAIPEPSSAAALAGLVTLGLVATRRRRAA